MDKQEFVDRADGARIHYRMRGAGDAVVFLHGIGSSSRSFAPLAAAMGLAQRTLAVDLRGYGQSSDRPLATGWQTYADDVAAVVDHASAGRVNLVAASAGAISALTWCHSQPHRVRSLTLIGPTLGDAGDPALARRLLAERRRALHQAGDGAADRAARMAGPHADGQALALLQAEQARIRHAGYGVLARLLAQTDAASLVATLRAPLQVIVGEDDVITGMPVANRVRELAQASMVTFPGVGHSPHVELPDRTAAAILAFIAAPDARAR